MAGVKACYTSVLEDYSLRKIFRQKLKKNEIVKAVLIKERRQIL